MSVNTIALSLTAGSMVESSSEQPVQAKSSRKTGRIFLSLMSLNAIGDQAAYDEAGACPARPCPGLQSHYQGGSSNIHSALFKVNCIQLTGWIFAPVVAGRISRMKKNADFADWADQEERGFCGSGGFSRRFLRGLPSGALPLTIGSPVSRFRPEATISASWSVQLCKKRIISTEIMRFLHIFAFILPRIASQIIQFCNFVILQLCNLLNSQSVIRNSPQHYSPRDHSRLTVRPQPVQSW